MRADRVTAVYALSRSFLPYFQLSASSLPPGMPVVVTWCHAGEIPPELRRPAVTALQVTTFTEVMNKSLALNIAIRAARTPWILVADADMLFPRFLADCLVEADPELVRRFYVARFNAELTRQVMAAGAAWERQAEMYAGRARFVENPSPARRAVRRLLARYLPQVRLSVGGGGGTVSFKEIYGSPNPVLYAREALWRLRGYDEEFVGWGFEDDDLYQRGRRAGLVEERVPLVVGHLDHPRISDFPQNLSRATGAKLIAEERPVAANPRGWGGIAEATGTSTVA